MTPDDQDTLDRTVCRISTVLAALALLAPATAVAMPPRYKPFHQRIAIEVRCDQLGTATVTHPKSRRPAKVANSTAWGVGGSVLNNAASPFGVIVATERVRDANGDLGIRWTFKGAYEACTDPSSAHRINSTFAILIKRPKADFSDCGSVKAVNGTLAFVEANGYATSCKRARQVASGWARYQNANNGIHPMLKFVSPSRILGYRCSGAKLGQGSDFSRVNCRKGRARVKWWW